MNMIEAIKAVLNATSSYGGANSARDTLHELAAAFDALKPKPDEWPEGAQWFTIDADGTCNRHATEPTPFDAAWESGTGEFAGVVIIPFGVDWRLLKWQRPEVAK